VAVRHKTVDLVDPFTGRTVAIDVQMVPIISALWALGMQTSGCCQGESAETAAQILEVAMRDPGFREKYGDRVRDIPPEYPAVVCFAGNGHLGWWGEPRRYCKGKQHATRLVVMLADVAPDDRWRGWRWEWDNINWCSAVVLPNEDLLWLAAQLERLERAAAGQLTLEEAPASWPRRRSSATSPPASLSSCSASSRERTPRR
jgi:hypothetical protein